MAGIPVYCPNCGAIFQSRIIGISGPVIGVTFSGNREDCINCGETARVIDGTFDFSKEGALSLISGSPLSRAVLEQFAGLVERAAKQEITKDQLLESAEKLDPVLGQVVSLLNAKHLGVAGLLLLMLFIRSCSFKLDATVDINKLYDQWTGHGTKTEFIPSIRANVKDASQDKRTGNTNRPGHGTGKK